MLIVYAKPLLNHTVVWMILTELVVRLADDSYWTGCAFGGKLQCKAAVDLCVIVMATKERGRPRKTNEDTPPIMCGDHCGKGVSGINHKEWVLAWFSYANPFCSTPTSTWVASSSNMSRGLHLPGQSQRSRSQQLHDLHNLTSTNHVHESTHSPLSGPGATQTRDKNQPLLSRQLCLANLSPVLTHVLIRIS